MFRRIERVVERALGMQRVRITQLDAAVTARGYSLSHRVLFVKATAAAMYLAQHDWVLVAPVKFGMFMFTAQFRWDPDAAAEQLAAVSKEDKECDWH